jgi:hypothetical protein
MGGSAPNRRSTVTSADAAADQIAAECTVWIGTGLTICHWKWQFRLPQRPVRWIRVPGRLTAPSPTRTPEG